MTNPLQPRLTILWAQVSGSEIAICDHHAAPLLHIAFERRIEFPFFFFAQQISDGTGDSLSAIAKQKVGWELVPRGAFSGGRSRRGDFFGVPSLGVAWFLH
jgi:hypothetical protein